MAGYKSVIKNNICAHLDLITPNARHFTDIITFLRRSRIFAAISTIHVPYQSHQQDFWTSADIDCEVEPLVIRGKVLGHDVVVSAEHIRRICGFQDTPDQPILLDHYLVRGCFMQCKYEGDLRDGILNKAFMSPQFKYLARVLIHCLGSRRGGFDDMRETIQCAFVALVLNRPFNFSEMIFTHMKENVMLKGYKKFLMYPRFLQQLIDAQLPDLPKINADIIRLEHMNDITLNRVMSYRGKERKPTVRTLFGHLLRPDYIAPVGRRWMHEDSNSDMEDIVIPGDEGDDDGDGGEGDVGGGASGVSVSSVGVSVVADVSVTTADVSMIEASMMDVGAVGVSTGAEAGTSVAFDDDVDIDSLMDLDFMATTTSTDEGGEAGDEGAESSNSEDTPDDEFEDVWVGDRLIKKRKKRSEAELEEITDPSFIPEFHFSPPPRTSIPTTTAVTVAATQASSSPSGRRKRTRFVL
ncbi:hypothetical protein R6Q57_019619 [Mikania cordata]